MMARNAFIAVAAVWMAAAVLAAQTPAPRAVMGTVTSFKPEALEMEVKPDTGDAVSVAFTPETIVQRVAPGSKDLKDAAPAKITDIAMGDRVLVSFAAGTKQARRVVVMSATDIRKHDEADTQDWTKRGVSGIVAAKNGNVVTVKMRSLQGETQATVTVSEKTKYKRYAPDSVRFLDARPSSLAEVSVGDQLRGRGTKSEDGLKVDADEVVFGTFLTKAGSITAIDPEGKQITVKDLVTNKPLIIKLTADSQVKVMPDLSAMFARMGQGGGAPGGARPGGMGGGAGAPGTGAPGAGGPGAGGRPGFDISQMLERMPAAKLDSLKPGQTIIVSSTKGATSDQVTAIMVLGNADFLIQMASRGSSARGGGGMGGGMGMGPSMGGLSGGLEGLGMQGMIP